LDDLRGAQELRLSDHHLGMHFGLERDEPDDMIRLAQFALDKTRRIAEAIARLPFVQAFKPAATAWGATAVEQGPFLVPTRPSIYGLVFRARVLGGDERSLRAAIRTAFPDGEPVTRVDLDLREAPLPHDAGVALERETADDRLRAVRDVFPTL